MTIRPSSPARSPRVTVTSRNRAVSAALMRFAAAAMRNDGIDPVTTELVRVRCASHHDCHT